MILIRLLEEHEYKEFFEFIKPFALIAPFGLYWDYEPEQKTCVITSKQHTKCFQHKKYEIRTDEDSHGKLAVGSEGAIFGSWNFSLSHEKASKKKELVFYTKTGSPLYDQVLDRFDQIWQHAHPHSKPPHKRITKLHEVL